MRLMKFITDRNGVSMSKMVYYYGRDIEINENSRYLDIFYKKIAYAKETIDMLHKVTLMDHDGVRINRCVEAIKFNIDFIEETGAKYDIKRMMIYYDRNV